ncbi:hypothetical protein E2C01_069341 [Portunus trituberculatus]|uniref:Uncharacterized protein n=1 Tax=Portunus trituberculatus TaxID=210409 RepID=A0A5B7I1X3_PORTR|nr:hypothetical protein [Portunus trituberculatus]
MWTVHTPPLRSKERKSDDCRHVLLHTTKTRHSHKHMNTTLSGSSMSVPSMQSRQAEQSPRRELSAP